MTSVSWSYDSKVPKMTVPLATHSTYYGSSSLASSSTNALVIDKYSPDSLVTNFKTVTGTPHSNTTIYDHDKPALGVAQARESWTERYQNIPIRQRLTETVPNVNVLKSKYTLRDNNTRPTALM